MPRSPKRSYRPPTGRSGFFSWFKVSPTLNKETITAELVKKKGVESVDHLTLSENVKVLETECFANCKFTHLIWKKSMQSTGFVKCGHYKIAKNVWCNTLTDLTIPLEICFLILERHADPLREDNLLLVNLLYSLQRTFPRVERIKVQLPSNKFITTTTLDEFIDFVLEKGKEYKYAKYTESCAQLHAGT